MNLPDYRTPLSPSSFPLTLGKPRLQLLACSLTLLGVTGAWADSPSAAAEAGSAAEAGTAEEAPTEGDVSIPPHIKEGAEEHLTQAQVDVLKKMTDPELGVLLDTEDEKSLSKDQIEITSALNKAAFESKLSYQTGDIKLRDGLAILHLDEAFRYLSPEDTQRVLVDGWGNPPGGETLGMIVPAKTSPLHERDGWAVIVTFAEDGYVEDGDAEDIDYDELLEQMKEDTAASNEERKAAGYGAIGLVGWAEPPRYDSATNRLYWAKRLTFEGADTDTLNYAIRVLGRKGVLELNAVASMEQLAQIRSDMQKVLPRAEFSAGERYADFNPDMDKVAAYGIGGLIAGKVLTKVGLFAGFFKILLAMKKLLIFGVIGIGALVAKLLGRKKAEGE